MSGTVRIDPNQIRTTAAQFRSQAMENVSETIGRLSWSLPDVGVMCGDDPSDHPSRQFAAMYTQHANKMLQAARVMADGLTRVGEALDKMARDYETADENASVV